MFLTIVTQLVTLVLQYGDSSAGIQAGDGNTA